jgi:hypothetical protein
MCRQPNKELFTRTSGSLSAQMMLLSPVPQIPAASDSRTQVSFAGTLQESVPGRELGNPNLASYASFLSRIANLVN